MNEAFERLENMLSENSFWTWLIVFGASLFAAYILKFVLGILSKRVRRWTEQTHSIWDDVVIDLVDGLRGWVLFIWIYYISTKSLEPTESVARILLLMTIVASIYQVALWGTYLIRKWHETVLKRRVESDPSSIAALGLMTTVLQAILIVILVLIGLSNLGINISALLAGLGVGGIAVALAAQNVLGDLLASLSIVLDKPFVVGDFIVAGSQSGTVEQIGIKTTRLRALSGEELILSNKDLLESRIQNFKRMFTRRIVINFGILYSTPPEKLESVAAWVKEIVQTKEKVKFDRCHFMRFGESSLDYELVFIVQDPDYNLYMDLQQKILVEMFQKFEQEKVGFAFPSRSVYVESLPEQKDSQDEKGSAQGPEMRKASV